MRLISLFAAVALAIPGWAQDARQIVERALERDEQNERLARQYTFIQRVEQHELDGSGAVKKTQSRTYDVTLLEGTPYTRLIAKDDRPLSPSEEKKEREKLEKSIRDRRRESEAARRKRLAEHEAEVRKEREALRQIPEAFFLRIAGDEAVDGRPAWIVEATPNPGFKPRGGGRMAKLFGKMKGRMWIGKPGYELLRVESETTDTITFGGILARIHKGTRFTFERTKVNDEVWMPKRLSASYSGRLALLKRLKGDLEITFRDFRKFQSDSRIVGYSDAPQK